MASQSNFSSNSFLQRYANLLLAMASGLLLFAAWPVSPLTLLIFIAWIPLLWLESRVSSRKKFFGLVYLTMFIWNIGATWWIWNASVPGALAAFFANSFIMCLPWLGFTIAKKRLGEFRGYLSLVAFWMCFEFIHLTDWGLSWPWLTLGNAFAMHPNWIQWYQYTGASGGTLWILIINILLYLHVKKNFTRNTEKTYKNLLGAIVLLVLPVAFSWFIGMHKPIRQSDSNIVVVQPNIDPYEKIATGTFEAQLQQLIHTTENIIDHNTALVLWPETALYMGNGIDEDHMKDNYFLNPLWSFLQRYPDITLFTGIESFKQFNTATKSSKEFDGFHYETYNGSALIDSSGPLGFYHKSMLVPGVETLPWFLRFIDSWFEKFGGTTAGYAKQKERTVLPTKAGYTIAPAICYESIYGEFMRRYIKKGANLICIITNDGWWKKTPGHKQHMHYARLRAIETRTWVARSANTGISCFIDPYGYIIDPQPYNTTAAIKLKLSMTPGQASKTFFVKHGDLLSKIMTVLSILLIIQVAALRIIAAKAKKKQT